jgi:hypothetical protein
MAWKDEQERLTQQARLNVASPEEVLRELKRIECAALRESTTEFEDDNVRHGCPIRDRFRFNHGTVSALVDISILMLESRVWCDH